MRTRPTHQEVPSGGTPRASSPRPGVPLPGRLGVRIMVGFLLVSLLPLLTSTALGYLRSSEILEGFAEGSVGAVSEVGVLHVRNRMDLHFLALHAIASGNEFLAAGLRNAAGDTTDAMAREAGPGPVSVYLQREWGADLGQFSALFLTDTRGNLVASTRRVEVTLTDLPGGSDDHRVITVQGPSESGPPSFLLLEPVTRITGEHVGFLGGLVRPSRANDFFQVAPAAGGAIETYIVDGDGRPIFASSGGNQIDYAAPLATPLLESGGPDRARYVDAAGREVIGTRSEIPGYPWIQITESPVDEAMASLRRLRQASLLLTLAFVVLVGIAAWLLSAQIVAPVRVLVSAVRRLGGGDLGARVDLDQNDEIGELARAFDTMAEDLQATSARAEALHQREIERAQQLATVGELASGLAHEIKNPMFAIANGMDLVRRRVPGSTELDPILDELSREVDRVQRTIRDLLAFARPSTPNPKVVDPNEVVEAALRLTRASASVSGVKLEVELEEDLPSVLVDPEQMKQALVNLILNALQATPSPGTVRVRTALAGDGGDEVRFEVSDTGPGIPEEQRLLVFKPFYTTRHTGTGLGLSISRGIVERHRGRLELHCPEEGGTVAHVLVPVADRVDAARTDRSALLSDVSPMPLGKELS